MFQVDGAETEKTLEEWDEECKVLKISTQLHLGP